jgi:hypothetical protein
MLILYIILGIASGLIAAIAAVVAGANLLSAFLAYVLAGSAATVLCICWSLAPRRSRAAKNAVTQRS